MAKKLELVTGKVRIPRCWQRLLALKSEALEKRPRLKGDLPVDSERAFRDDDRWVSTKLSDGTVLAYNLSSGDNNYWVGCIVHRDTKVVNEEECLYQGEVCAFPNATDEFVHNGKKYVITLEWYGRRAESAKPTPKSKRKPFRVVITWGQNEEVRKQSRSEYEFDTKAELDAFLYGVEEAQGWLDYEIVRVVPKE